MNNKIELPKKVNSVLTRHIVCLNQLSRDKEELQKQGGLIGAIKSTAKELALWMADFKCENPKCRSEDKLTLHHFIQKNQEDFVKFIKFFKQRNYYGNQCILCVKCHGKVDCIGTDNHQVISDRRIKIIKKKLGVT